jgi:hypothetical protein
MASESITEEIVSLLRAGVASSDIAQRLNISPPVVLGVKSHWRLGKYGDELTGAFPMENPSSTDAIALLTALAEGVDPFTGEVLPEDHLLQQPQIVRALFHSINALKQQPSKTKKISSTPEKAGTAWAKQEDEDLVRQFDEKVPITEIAKLHGRSRGAITSRLVRLGKIVLPQEPNHAASNT